MAKDNDSTLLREKLLDFVTDPDPLLSMLEWLTSRLMKLEAEAKVGVEKGKNDESRTTNFSGIRVRRFDTRLGTMYLLVPKLRRGGYIPFFVTERKRSEHALIEMVLEAYANGVSTRKIDHLARAMGIENISASQVSEITKELDSQVEVFRTRPLEPVYPVIWVDAVYEKIRKNGRVVSMAVMVVTGVNLAGTREILAVQPMWNESEESYTELFESLKARGLSSVHLIVSDAHKGLQGAIKREFLNSSWQRCKVHFMRNILAVSGTGTRMYLRPSSSRYGSRQVRKGHDGLPGNLPTSMLSVSLTPLLYWRMAWRILCHSMISRCLMRARYLRRTALNDSTGKSADVRQSLACSRVRSPISVLSLRI